MLKEVLMSLVMTLANYIFINAISAKSQQQTVLEFKQVFNYMRTDQMNQMKELENNLMNQIKETELDIKEKIQSQQGGKKEQ